MQNPFDLFVSDPWRAMEHLKSLRHFAGGEFLFHEGERCRGVYLVKRGEVRLLMEFRHKEYRVLETVGQGTCLGLNEVMGGMTYKFTAQAVGAVEADHIERTSLMRFLRKHHEVSIQIVGLLSDSLNRLYGKLRLMAKTEAKRKRKQVSSRVQ